MGIKRRKFASVEAFSGSIKEFVELMTPAARLPVMIVSGKWMLGQTLYVKVSSKGPIITNQAF